MTKCTGILVDPFTCTISRVEVDRDDYTAIYPLISHESMPVDIFEAARVQWLRGNDVAFVDEEGLLKPCDRFVFFLGHSQPLAGKALILGADDEGNTADAMTDIDTVLKRTVFLEPLGPMLVSTDKPWHATENA